MGLTAKEKRSATKVTAPRHQKAKKRQKGRILEEFVALSGYDRCYAASLLRTPGTKVCVDKNTVIVADAGKKALTPRKRVYDHLAALGAIWHIMDCICGKRLAPMLKTIIPILERHHEIQLAEETRTKLFSISSATIDRLLKPERKKHTLKGAIPHQAGNVA